MNKKTIKYLLGLALLLFLGYNSIYFRKLDEVKAEKEGHRFDAAKFAEKFWQNDLPPALATAVDIKALLPMLANDPTRAFNEHSHALGIGNFRYILIRVDGMVEDTGADHIIVSQVDGLPGKNFKVATGFIFGNAARDASGKVDINAFVNTMDFNNVSAEINKLVESNVVPRFRGLKHGDDISVTGAIELHREHPDTNHMEIIPLSLTVAK